MAEQLICNQQVDGSTPFTSSKYAASLRRYIWAVSYTHLAGVVLLNVYFPIYTI